MGRTRRRTLAGKHLYPKGGHINVSLWGAKQTSSSERVTSAFDPTSEVGEHRNPRQRWLQVAFRFLRESRG